MDEAVNFSNREDIKAIMRLRRARQMALAIIKRSREAGIPDKYMRLKESVFASLLDPDYHGGPIKGVPVFAHNVYNEPDFLMKKDFIAIDGGTTEERLMAGHAILFRMIAYDNAGKYYDCISLAHKFQTINSTDEITRNNLADTLKLYDALFLSEFDALQFNPHFEAGSFLDEVLAGRINQEMPTIVTFCNPIVSERMTPEKKTQMAIEGKLDAGGGRYLALLSLTPQTTRSVLRIRVKSV